MYHFRVLEGLKVTKPVDESKDEQARTQTPTRTGKKEEIISETNVSNEWRIYAKMEGNFHLTNKYALFFNMSRYYKSIGQDPFDVLPLSFHIKSGTTDATFYNFLTSFKEFEEKANLEVPKEDTKAVSQSVIATRTHKANPHCPKCENDNLAAKQSLRQKSKKGPQGSPTGLGTLEKPPRAEEKSPVLPCYNDRK